MTRTTPLRAGTVRLAAASGPAIRKTFRRYRPGTYSATVETIRLTDGRSVRTDLIRLNPNLECYSLDLDGSAPRRVASYTVTPWAEAPALRSSATDVGTILRASYPAVGLAELSARVRADGRPLGAGNLRAHEAIAATQAALWRVTNAVELDTRPLTAPVAAAVRHDGHPAAMPVPPERPAWIGTVTRERLVRLELTLAERLQLTGYSVAFALGSQSGGLRVSLERSPDGSTWTPVPSSAVTAVTGTFVHKVLGVGATVADGRGYRHYRVVLATDSPPASRIGVEQVSLAAAGAPVYRNPSRVVHLYEYLVDTLRRQAAAPEQVRVALAGTAAATKRTFLVGPIRVQGVAPGQRFTVRALDPGACVVDPDGNPVFEPVTSSDPVLLRLPRRRFPPAARVSVTLRGPARPEPRLLLGASSPGAPAQFAPVVGLLDARWEAASTFLLDVTCYPHRMEGVD